MAISKKWDFWLWCAKLLPKKLQYACWMYVLAGAAKNASAPGERPTQAAFKKLSHERVSELFWSGHD